jgi:NitT/TauT family transport system ATP-binding protein
MNLAVDSLALTYPGKTPFLALHDLSFTVDSGQFVAIIGPSGCGKSSLLRLIGDLLHPSDGTIRIDGRPPADIRSAHRVAWMAQSPALLPWLTARGNVDLAARLAGRASGSSLDPREALRKVGLGQLNGEYPFSLSGGMQQRLALARLLVQDAGLWLMDEPFSALDEITREALAGELLEIWRPLQPTVLWVTHNIYEALRLADRVLVMSAAPGTLTADVPVNLDRPRRESSPEFQALLARLRQELARAAGAPARQP